MEYFAISAEAPTLRERYHKAIWTALWPARTWFSHFPLHRGKGLLYRCVILPALPPKPARFPYRLPTGETVDLYYREDLGTKVLFEGAYEDEEIAALCKLAEPGSCVFDVGANIGLSALALSRAVGSAGSVIALEANPDTADRLEGNLERNRAENVRVVREAAGANVGTTTFFESEDPTLSSATVIPRDLTRSFEVPVTTVDTVWKNMGHPRVSAIKIDVEGGELDVLEGAARMLAEHRPAILLEAWSAEQLEPISRLLERNGYCRHQGEAFSTRNYLFVGR